MAVTYRTPGHHQEAAQDCMAYGLISPGVGVQDGMCEAKDGQVEGESNR